MSDGERPKSKSRLTVEAPGAYLVMESEGDFSLTILREEVSTITALLNPPWTITGQVVPVGWPIARPYEGSLP